MMAIWVTMVLHRHFPVVQETPDLEGLFRYRKSVAEREGFAPPLQPNAQYLVALIVWFQQVK